MLLAKSPSLRTHTLGGPFVALLGHVLPTHAIRQLCVEKTINEPVNRSTSTHVKSCTVGCLPNEILGAIMESVSIHDLTCVVRVCQRLYDVGSRVLYGRMSLVDTVTPDALGNPRPLIVTSQCCSTLVRRPHLASLVHYLRIELRRSPDAPLWILPGTITAPIGTILRQLSNLTKLELQVLGASLTEILSDCPFSLTVFSCDTCDPRPLHGFLTSQSNLTELHLTGPTQPVGPFFLSHRYGSRLRKISGTLDLVASIVPGRPVEEVQIVDAFLNTEMVKKRVHFLKASAATIKVFRIVTVICQASMIEVIAENLPGIEVLGLHIMAPSDRHLPYVNLLDTIAPVIAILPYLRQIDACSIDEYEHAHWLEHLSKERTLLIAWSKISRTLKRARFPTGAEWARRRDGSWTHVHTTPAMYEIESGSEAELDMGDHGK